MRLEALDLRLERDVSRPIAVAFSGGSDSAALLLLASRWAQANGRRLLALTVDHQLNPDSARWTAEAGETAARLGVDWRPLAWAGPKPETGLPAAARRARHALLAEAARMAGAHVILMGHTRDDVAESALIRQATPTHGRLEPWAPSPVWPEGREVFLLRPLLGVHRAELRAMLSAEGMGWLEDPANADPRYARSRARVALADGEHVHEDDDAAALGWLEGSATADATGSVRLARTAPADLLAKALLCVSGRERPAPGDAVRRLADRLRSGEDFAATLGGARLQAAGAQVRIVRDAGERMRGGLSPLVLAAGERGIFDGRFEIEAMAGVQVVALPGLAGRLPPGDAAALKALSAEARPALPVLVQEDGAVNLPSPFGGGPARARALAPRRLAAACGRIADEAQAASDTTMWTELQTCA